MYQEKANTRMKKLKVVYSLVCVACLYDFQSRNSDVHDLPTLHRRCALR